MTPPATPADELERLDSLRALDVLDSPAEAEFDALVMAASAVCGTPVSLLSLVDADRQWFKANIGMDDVHETPRDVSFCGHAILEDGVFEIPDAWADSRFRDNPLTQGERPVRFYAGAPVILSDGAHVGTLCVIDHQPRALSPHQRTVLSHLSEAAAKALEGRRAMRQVAESLAQAQQRAEQAQRNAQRLNFVLESMPSTLAYWDTDLICRFANNVHLDWYGCKRDSIVGIHLAELLGEDNFRKARPHIEGALAGTDQCFERTVHTRDGRTLQTLVFYLPEIRDGKVVGLLAQSTDVTQARLDNESLRRYREAAEAERELAGFLLTRMSRMETLQQPGIAHYWQPAEAYSGDLIAVARSSSGDLYGMLADATGHGLAAALNLIPLSTTFYELAEKGFGLKTIAQKLNKVVRDTSPTDRFIAVTLLRFRFREDQLEVINAGNPPALLINRDREATREVVSGCTPLGIVDPRQFEPVLEECPLGKDDVVLLFSDGVIEASDATGRAFGLAGVQTAIYAAASGDDIVPSLKHRLERHCAGEIPSDDVTVLALVGQDLATLATIPVERSADTEDPGTWEPVIPWGIASHEVEGPAHDRADWQLAVSFGGEQLRRIDPVPSFMELMRILELEPQVESRLFTLLSELTANALEHGLLGLDSAIKHHPGGFERYFDLRAERLAALDDGHLSIQVEHRPASPGSRYLRISVRDSGAGFDHVSLLNRLNSGGAPRNALPSGRGIALVISLSDQVHFSPRGNEVSCTFRYGAPGGT